MTKINPEAQASTSAALWLVLLVCLSLAGTWAPAQTFTTLHRFHSGNDGQFPYDRLFLDSSGHLYGSTAGGGTFGYGTVFEINAKGKTTVLHSFWGGDGQNLWGGLIRDESGNFYGTAVDGGTLEHGKCMHGCGTVFKLDSAGKLSVLHAFSGGTDGAQPQFGLLRDNAGNLFGTTTLGGDLSCNYGNGCGVVFELDSNGEETVLHAFSGKDGERPSGDLIRDKAGNFYGVTESGGAFGYGALFRLAPNHKETVLYSFSGPSSGEYPVGRLARDAQGNFYGTTNVGGKSSCFCGVVFKVDKAGHESVLHVFTGNPDGALPFSGITRDASGNLYGTTYGGGGAASCFSYGCGSVFKVDTKGNETVLHGFSGGSDGGIPFGALIVDQSGNLYGTAPSGGDPKCGCGVIFKLSQ